MVLARRTADGLTVSEGDGIRFDGGPSPSLYDGTVERVLRPFNPSGPDGNTDWAMQVRNRDGKRFILTPARSGGKLNVVGRDKQTGLEGPSKGVTPSSPFSPLGGAPTLNDVALLGRWFQMPLGTRIVSEHDLVAMRHDPPAKVQRAAQHMADAAGGGNKRLLLAVHVMDDGRLAVLDGNATLEAGRQLGLDRFPVMPDALLTLDAMIGAESAHGSLDPMREGVLDGPRVARWIVASGGGQAEVASAGVAFGGDPAKPQAYDDGWHTGMRSAWRAMGEGWSRFFEDQLASRRLGEDSRPTDVPGRPSVTQTNGGILWLVAELVLDERDQLGGSHA